MATRMPPAGPRADGSAHRLYWPQETLRRAAQAVRYCRSNDSIVIARAVLEAAIRDHADLCDLLALEPPTPSTRHTVVNVPV
jgi:hypothetical protein